MGFPDMLPLVDAIRSVSQTRNRSGSHRNGNISDSSSSYFGSFFTTWFYCGERTNSLLAQLIPRQHTQRHTELQDFSRGGNAGEKDPLGLLPCGGHNVPVTLSPRHWSHFKHIWASRFCFMWKERGTHSITWPGCLNWPCSLTWIAVCGTVTENKRLRVFAFMMMMERVAHQCVSNSSIVAYLFWPHTYACRVCQWISDLSRRFCCALASVMLW